MRLNFVASMRSFVGPCLALVAMTAFAATASANPCERALTAQSPAISEQSQNSEELAMDHLVVSAVQFPIDGGQTLESFMNKVRVYVDRAVESRAQLVVFPELIGLDLLDHTSGRSTSEQLEEIAAHATPRFFEAIASLSAQKNVAILAGSMPRLVSENPIRVGNTAFLALPDGRRIFQDKLFMTPDEQAWGWVPGDKLRVFQAPWGRTAILICYDGEFPLVSNLLASKLPEIILVPSMTDSDHGFHRVRWASQARAIEHHSYVVHTGTVGISTAGDAHVGQASFLTPHDNGFPGVLLEGERNARTFVTAVLDLRQLRQSQQTAGIYPARDQARRSTPIQVVEDR